MGQVGRPDLMRLESCERRDIYSRYKESPGSLRRDVSCFIFKAPSGCCTENVEGSAQIAWGGKKAEDFGSTGQCGVGTLETGVVVGGRVTAIWTCTADL